jgi:hypothetical protein
MADLNLGKENVELSRARFFWRVEFLRNEGSGDIVANVFFKDTAKLADGANSGSVLAQSSFILTVPNEHVRVTGFGTFFNNFLSMCNNVMSNYYTNGTVVPESGSLNKLDQF